jgi:hypothetical protein
VQRILTITRELENIQVELTGPAAGQAGNFLADAQAVQALNSLKAELDQLRRILWFYLEEAAAKPGSNDNAKSSLRLEPGTPAQRKLAFQSNGHSAAAEPAWFFDRLDLVIESYMQKKPASAETKMVRPADAKAFS